MPKVTLKIEVEVMDEKHCSYDCKYRKTNCTGDNDFEYCEFCDYVLDKDSIGFMRHEECLAAEVKEEVCKWTYDENEGFYYTECDSSFIFNYDRKDDAFKFCPYCGKKIS